ncbi:hypothetical protein DS833_00330 [Lactobacillus bombicola]|nr:hypothetical protein DS833_00330 [Lactobacillus bombicola]
MGLVFICAVIFKNMSTLNIPSIILLLIGIAYLMIDIKKIKLTTKYFCDNTKSDWNLSIAFLYCHKLCYKFLVICDFLGLQFF